MRKNNILWKMSFLSFIGTLLQQAAIAWPTVMTFEEAYDIANRTPRRLPELSSVEKLKPQENRWLTAHPERVNWLLRASSQFRKLYSLDFSRQDIDDAFTERLTQQGFERVYKINLSGNPRITSRSLQLILDSDSLGSVRESEMGSVRHGGGTPSSKIEIKVGGTSITPQDVTYFNSAKADRFDFNIHYRRPDGGVLYASTTSIKELEVTWGKLAYTMQRREIGPTGTGEQAGTSMSGPTGPYVMVGPTGVVYIPPWGLPRQGY